jgi:hypothetical protein
MALFLMVILPSKFDSMTDCSLICAAPHRQLGAGFADRLRRDDADRFAMVDRRAAGEIAAVALAANAVDEFAGQCGADLHFLDAGLLDGVDVSLLH